MGRGAVKVFATVVRTLVPHVSPFPAVGLPTGQYNRLGRRTGASFLTGANRSRQKPRAVLSPSNCLLHVLHRLALQQLLRFPFEKSVKKTPADLGLTRVKTNGQ